MSKNKSDVKGKLSTRVMNMKFMKEAQQVENEIETRETQRKLKDSSEWRINKSDQYLSRLAKPRVIVSASFADAAGLNQESLGTIREGINPGRRKFGKKHTLLSSSNESDDKSTSKRSLDTEAEDDDGVDTADLERLWAEEKSSKTRQKTKKHKKGKK